MSFRCYFVMCLLVFNKLNVECINILVLEEVPSLSHHLWIRTVTVALAQKGYNVTSLSADVDNETTTNLHYLHLDKVYDRLNEIESYVNAIESGEASSWMRFTALYGLACKACQAAVESVGWKLLQNYPDDFKFDLVIHDYIFGYCHLAFLDKFKNPPLIALSAFNDIQIPAMNMQYIMTPSTSSHYYLKELTNNFLERTENFLMHFSEVILRSYYFYPKIDKILKSTCMETAPVNELRRRTKIVLLNHDPVVDAQQLPPSIIGVGGLQIQPVKPLPQDLQSILDRSTKGLILLSFGTNVPFHTIGNARIHQIFEAFRQLSEYTFLCKSDLDMLPVVSIPSNVLLRKWIPQTDVLGHKNTKLFITHSGLLSTQEAIWHGVPILGIPIFADQFHNIAITVRKGVAERVDWKDLTTEVVYGKIRQILENPKYSQNIKTLSKLFRDQKEPPLDRAIWWIEWILRNPHIDHLNSLGSELNFIQLHSIDIVALALLIIFSMVWIVKIMITNVLCKILKLKQRSSQGNKGKID